MRALLTEKEKIRFTPKYVKTHQNVYRNVAVGVAPAGGGVQKTLEKEDPSLKDQLSVFYKTPGSASHPVAAHSRISKQFRKNAERAILKLAADPKNKDLFKNIQIPEPVSASYRKDYFPLKQLGLEKYVEIEKE